MIYLRKFDSHTSYEADFNVGSDGGFVEISLPNASYCKDVKDVHYTPYNTVGFYVGEITGTTPQTVNIYTDNSTSVDIEVSEGNKWYSYLLPKDKELFRIEGDSVTKVVVRADINTNDYTTFIPTSTIEASFKGSDTSKVTYMDRMFGNCSGLTSLNLSSFNTSNVTTMDSMFSDCVSLTSLDVSSFNTSNVTKMNNMFYNCSGLTSLDLSNFNVNNVFTTGSMFQKCSSLTFLDLSKWNITNTSYAMFSGCHALKTIRMVGCNQTTINKIKAQLTTDGIINNVKIVTE